MNTQEGDKPSAGELSRDQDAAAPGPEDARAEETPAEEAEVAESEAAQPTGEDGGALDQLEREVDVLRAGETLDSPLGPLPKRSLVAIVIVVVVAVAIFFPLWALLGDIALILGWIPALALGFLAAREYGRRDAS